MDCWFLLFSLCIMDMCHASLLQIFRLVSAQALPASAYLSPSAGGMHVWSLPAFLQLYIQSKFEACCKSQLQNPWMLWLQDGGCWINLGPLLFHWADAHTYLSEEELSIELSLEEVEAAAKQLGFKTIKREMVPAAYMTNLRWCFAAATWVRSTLYGSAWQSHCMQLSVLLLMLHPFKNMMCFCDQIEHSQWHTSLIWQAALLSDWRSVQLLEFDCWTQTSASFKSKTVVMTFKLFLQVDISVFGLLDWPSLIRHQWCKALLCIAMYAQEHNFYLWLSSARVYMSHMRSCVCRSMLKSSYTCVFWTMIKEAR